MGENICDLRQFLDIPQETTAKTVGIASKLKPVVLHSLQENKKTNNGKIFANHILDKGLVSRIFKELLLN